MDLRCVNHVLVDVLRQPKNNEMKEGSVSYILNPNDLPKKLFPILGDGNINIYIYQYIYTHMRIYRIYPTSIVYLA